MTHRTAFFIGGRIVDVTLFAPLLPNLTVKYAKISGASVDSATVPIVHPMTVQVANPRYFINVQSFQSVLGPYFSISHLEALYHKAADTIGAANGAAAQAIQAVASDATSGSKNALSSARISAICHEIPAEAVARESGAKFAISAQYSFAANHQPISHPHHASAYSFFVKEVIILFVCKYIIVY